MSNNLTKISALLILCFSASPVFAGAVNITKYTGMSYEQAKILIVQDGWEPLPPKNPPPATEFSTQFINDQHVEFERCYADSCAFRFKKENLLLGVWVNIDKYEKTSNLVDKAYQNVDDAAATTTQAQTAATQPTDAVAAQKTMTIEECTKADSNTFLFLSSAGIKDYDRLYNPMMALIKNGSYEFQGASIKNGKCMQKILVSGVYMGTSYRQLIEGEAMK